MLRRPARILGVLAGGLAASLAVAVLAAQLSYQPACSIAEAQQLALHALQIRPNAKRPIWPAFEQRGRGVTIRGFHTEDSPTEARPNGSVFITVAIEAGWPWRCLEARTAYLATGGWSTDHGTIRLLNRRHGPGIPTSRDLPVNPLWLGLAGNTAIFSVLLVLVIFGPVMMRSGIRRRRGHCPACNYPIGQSAVCTECGRPV